jgi:hypothetical protein
MTIGTPRAFGWLLLLWASTGCRGDHYFLMHEEYLTDASGEENYLGGGCTELEDGQSSGSGAGGESTPIFVIEERGTDRGVLVSVFGEANQKLLQRFYDEEFLLSDKVDELLVMFTTEQHLRLKYWGGSRCEPVRALEPDAD